ncbi:MAG TPA: thiamine pyrophosphate-dependent enzyme [Gaiellales bacterium]|jgi:benzoylformate decarboxylase
MTSNAGRQTVREATFDVMRRLGMTRIFGNPGSTEIPFLTDLPGDLEYVLGLHEGAVVGMASGYALGTGRPAFVNLHTAAGLGNAVNAIAGARDNRVPLVIVVGQQDRRQLAYAPFLTGQGLERMAGESPVWTSHPAEPSAVPGAIARAWHEAGLRRGPAVVVVPMGDWEVVLDAGWAGLAAPDRVACAPLAGTAAIGELTAALRAAESPVLIVGAGTDTVAGWKAATRLAERLGCPVWQDTFSSRAGFPQDHPQFAGHLPWRRREIRATLAGHDAVVALGTPAFRLYLYEPGAFVEPGTRVLVVTDDADEALRSRCDLAVVAPPAQVCDALADALPARTAAAEPMRRPKPPTPPTAGGPLRPEHVLAALAERLPAGALLVEEAPSHRPELLARVAVRAPFGFLAVANGALGFGLTAAIGARMALPDRPVLALLGDGSAMYTIQALWTAARYRVGVVVLVMANGRYAVMDELADRHGGRGAWPAFEELDLTTIAQGMGCPAVRVTEYGQLLQLLDEVVPDMAARAEPLLLDVRVTVG